MKNYLEKKEYQRNSSFILVAPTGTGKTTALIEHLRETKEQCIFVAPLNALGKQIFEKANGLFKIINCEHVESTILGDIHYALLQGESIVISLTTFIKYKDIFYKYNVYIDECHLLTDYKEIMNTNGLIIDIRNNKFKKIVGLTATAFGLDKLLNLPLIKPKVKPQSVKHIELSILKEFKLENVLFAILEIFKVHKKIIFFLNNTIVLHQLKNELVERNIKALLYTAENKDFSIIDETIDSEFDIILCTSSLATGVSIKNSYYAIYIPQSFDSINLIAQFFSRNRNSEVYGCILKRSYKDKECNLTIENNEFFGKTEVNKTMVDTIYKKLTQLNLSIGIKILNYFINTSNDYIFTYGQSYKGTVNLLKEQRYEDVVPDQLAYFIENEYPKFNKQRYKTLYRIYQLYDLIIYGAIKNSSLILDDSLMLKYSKDFISINGEFILNREKFYNFCYERVKKYDHDKSIKIASQTTSNSLNLKDFEDKFLNKIYVKKDLKDYCIDKFAIKEEVFKNKDTISVFLSQIGYCLKRYGNNSMIRKL